MQHDGLGSDGDLIDQGVAARAGRIARSPDHGELDDLVDVARTQQDRGWVRQQLPPEPTHCRQRRRVEPRVYVWEYMTATSRHNGGMRSISATFRMTEPTDAQAMESRSVALKRGQ
ncbi:hypothetical protein [Streptomyces sp. NBC_01579]|uniref:hypothetical protein n=1 Tax=Streptomyces sp. NBC_01579 TaxID=2975885 RepID=UPI002F912548